MEDNKTELNNQIEQNITQLTTMIEELKKEIESLKEKERKREEVRKNICNKLQESETTVEKEIQKRNILESRILKLELEKEKSVKARRKNNLIITGLNLDEKELESELKHFFEDQLQIKINIKNIFTFRRFGKQIIGVTVETFEEKLAVLKNKYKLQRSHRNIFINNDLTPQEQQIRIKK